GSKDPYALRRAALGIIRTILQSELRVSFSRFVALSNFNVWLGRSDRAMSGAVQKLTELSQYIDFGTAGVRIDSRSLNGGAAALSIDELQAGINEAVQELLSFFAERLKVYLREQGARYDL